MHVVSPDGDVPISEAPREVFHQILLVCIGNVCRSPAAEILFRHRLGGKGVQPTPAGLAVFSGHSMDATAPASLSERGMDGGDLGARRIDEHTIRCADPMPAMERAHIEAITRAPHASDRVLLWGRRKDMEIPDPYRRQRPAFEHACRVIDASAAGWLPHSLPRRPFTTAHAHVA